MKVFQWVIYGFVVSTLACTKPCLKDPVDIEVIPPAGACSSWSRLFGGTASDVGWAVAKAPDGGYIVAGTTHSVDGDIIDSEGNGDFSVVKFTSTGTKVWQRTFGGPTEETATAITAVPGGGYVILGAQAIAGGSAQLYIIKIDEGGSLVWEQTWLGPGFTASNALLSFGNELVIAADCSNINDVQPWLIKLDLLGNITMEKAFGHPMRYEFPMSIVPATDGGYIVAGYTIDDAGEDAWVAKVDPFGDVEWERFTSGTDIDEWMDVIPTADGTGDYMLVGQSTSTDGDLSGNHGDFDLLVARMGPAGNTKWRKLLGGTAEEMGLSIVKNAGGNYVIAGVTRSGDGDINGLSAAAQNRGAWVVQVNAAGTILNQKVLGGSLEDFPVMITTASDCGYLMVGYSLSNNGDLSGNHKPGVADAWAAKISF